ncbi:S1 family peptidase [Streptomyces sp. WMMC905]|uniref:S1 family peptidase n=1 Tax=Streptomyces sp. WMMC905 TaxID=3404123 RepID=UPI003B949709
MRHARRRMIRRGARAMAAGGLLLGTVMVAGATASEPVGPDDEARLLAGARGAEGADLVARLGADRTAGHWIDDEGDPVVAVTDEEAASRVREAGAEAAMVRHSMSELSTAATGLGEAPSVPGTAWVIDYRSNEVVLRGDSTVSETDWSRLAEITESMGARVRMERIEGRFTTRLNGAEAILSTAGRCSAGFNVTDGERDLILTAGHCGPTGSVWFAEGGGGGEVGETVSRSFPGDDYSLVEYAGGEAGTGAEIVSVGEDKGVRITGAGVPAVGQRVFRSGSTTGLRDGRVVALDATVNYPEGTVTGLIETDVCAEPGDSGGPMFSDGVALGVTSGGNGDCSRGGTTYFQPVGEAMEALGVRLLVASGDGSAPDNGIIESAGGGAAVDSGPGTPSAGGEGASLPARLAGLLVDRANLTPGLLLAAGSLAVLVATRWIRAEHDRSDYRRRYSASWS